MTRKQLVEGLRVIHEADEITKIVSRAKRIDISFRSANKDCLLVIPNPPTTNDHNRNKRTTTICGLKATSTISTNTTNDNRPANPDPIRSTQGRKDNSTQST